MSELTECYLYSMMDDDGVEKIIAYTWHTNGAITPLVGATIENMIDLLEMAEYISEEQKKKFNLLKFKLIERYDENGNMIEYSDINKIDE